MARALDGRALVKRVVFTVAGTGARYDQGYPADIARALNPDQWIWQGAEYPAAAVPMQPSIDAGEAELVRLILLPEFVNLEFALVGYSQGAIVTSNVYDRLRTGDLQAHRHRLVAGATLGNPRRQNGHTIPNGIDPGGQGVVVPQLQDCEVLWWDLADGKNMVNSPGNDFYTVSGTSGAIEAADENAIWKIIASVQFFGAGSIVSQVLDLLLTKDLIPNTVGAIEAAVHAIEFFIFEGIGPHTSYQFVEPIKDDPRDCWRVIVDYLNSVGSIPAKQFA